MGEPMGALCAADRRAVSTWYLVFLVSAGGSARLVDARHSMVVTGVVLTRWRGSAIVGVVNMTRWVSRSRVPVGFSPVV